MSVLCPRVLLYDDAEYPELLRTMKYPPKSLYIIGNYDSRMLEYSVGIVGSRNMSLYGSRVVSHIVSALDQSIVVISGLTRGVDAKSHNEAIRQDMKTIAVLPGGLLSKYARSHDKLITEIIQSGGVVLSEFADSFEPKIWSYVKRNRIIAGLSGSLIVIEAGKNSGSLITARYAVEFHRKLFSVPGSIFSTLSEGTNLLISEGAIPILSGSQVNEYLGLAGNSGTENEGECAEQSVGAEKNLSGVGKAQSVALAIKQRDRETGEIAGRKDKGMGEKVFSLLRANNLTSSELSVITNIPVELINTTLTSLLLSGRINQEGGEFYVDKG